MIIMNTITPYLFFNGNCREALTFYQRAIGGELQIMTYGEALGDRCPEGFEDAIMHGAIRLGARMLMMASDAKGTEFGSNIQLSLNCTSVENIDELFASLSRKGKVTQALHDAKWGDRFGTLTDRYGVHWMLNFSPKA